MRTEKNIGRDTSQGSAYVFSKGLVPDFTMKEWSIILTVLTGSGILYYLRRRRKEKRIKDGFVEAAFKFLRPS